MNGNIIRLFTMITLLPPLLLWGCGAGPGAPGSSGSEDTGIQINSVTIIGNDATPKDVDVNVHLCSDGKPEPILLLREDATITVNASKLNPKSTFNPFPASVEECTITYRKPNDDPAAPIIEAWTIFPNCAIGEGSNSCVVNLLDIQRKRDFWNDIITGKNVPAKMPVRYVAAYDCKYVNNVGKSGHFQVEYEIFLADFELCP